MKHVRTGYIYNHDRSLLMNSHDAQYAMQVDLLWPDENYVLKVSEIVTGRPAKQCLSFCLSAISNNSQIKKYTL